MVGLRAAAGAFGLTLLGASAPFILGALAPFLLAELRLDPEQFGVAVGAFFGASALCSFGGGNVVVQLGPRRAMWVAAALAGLALLSIATWVSSFAALVVALIIAGMSNGFGQPASNAAIAAMVPARRRALSMGVKQGAIPLGGALAGLSVPIIAIPWGWRWSVVAITVLGFALVALTPVIARGSCPAGGRARSVPPHFPLLLVIACVGFLGAMGATAMGSFLVTSLVTEDGYGADQAALLVMVGSVAAVVVRIVLGMAVDRFGISPFPLIAVLLALSGVCFVLLASGSPAGVLAAAAIGGLLGSSGWQGLFQFGVVHQVPSDPARATGVTQSGMFLGAFVGPLVFGFASAAMGFGSSWAMLAVSASLGAVIALAVAWRIRARPGVVHAVSVPDAATL